MKVKTIKESENITTLEIGEWAITYFADSGDVKWFHNHKDITGPSITPMPWSQGCKQCGRVPPEEIKMIVELQKLKFMRKDTPE